MFAEYDYSNFPIVVVKFRGTIENSSEFELFINQWKLLYEDQKEFEFLFDMKDMGLVNPLYSFKMASFISELKKEPIQYLKRSKIINVNSFTKYLLHLIFSVQSPVAPVEIYHNDGSMTSVAV